MIELPSPALIGVIHLPALPGSPGHFLPMDEIVDRALADAKSLKAAKFDAVVVENFGDAPFPRDRVSSATLASMAVIADRVRRETGLALGINALRNDAIGALGIAAAVGAKFIRVNVHTGVYATDQGLIEGRADETMRYRKQLGLKIAVFADVNVKHAVPVSQPDVARAAKDTAYRGLADALVVTGPATGESVNMDELRRVRAAVPNRRLMVGSGAKAETLRELLSVADGVIVGSGIKPNGDTSLGIDETLARAFSGAIGR